MSSRTDRPAPPAGARLRDWLRPVVTAAVLASGPAWPAALGPEAAPANAPASAPASAAVAAPAAASAAALESCNEPLCYTASRLDAERNRMVLHDIDIIDTTRGKTHITADLAEATGLDLGDSQWVLTGHVHVTMPEGQLTADRATVTFMNKRIASMTADGAPAEFEHTVDGTARPPSGAPAGGQSAAQAATAVNAHGHARQIIFDMDRNQLQLIGDGWLTDGCSEISSQHITYDIDSQRVQADSAPGEGGARVHGTIRPHSPGQCAPQGTRP